MIRWVRCICHAAVGVGGAPADDVEGASTSTAAATATTRKRRRASSAEEEGTRGRRRQRIKYDPTLKTSSCSSFSGSSDDSGDEEEEGHVQFEPGLLIRRRFQVQEKLGEGTFGQVLRVKDTRRRNKELALKIVKRLEKYRVAARMEVKMLRTIARHDPDSRYCVRMLEAFSHLGHICIAFNVLGPSVYEFLASNQFKPFPMQHVQHIGRQMCEAVGFLHQHHITHTDLKPENMLFICSDYDLDVDDGGPSSASGSTSQQRRVLRCADIRLIDFGSATFEHEHHSSVVSTRHYRAPEVILKLGWSHPCDVWSVGCVLLELYTGWPLFESAGDRQHLAMMQRVLGPMAPRLAGRAASTTSHFTAAGRLRWDHRSKAAHCVRQQCRPLRRYCRQHRTPHLRLFDVIRQMLDYDPDKRVQLDQVLCRPFFNMSVAATGGVGDHS